MLVLGRRKNELIHIGSDIKVTVIAIRGDRVPGKSVRHANP